MKVNPLEVEETVKSPKLKNNEFKGVNFNLNNNPLFRLINLYFLEFHNTTFIVYLR